MLVQKELKRLLSLYKSAKDLKEDREVFDYNKLTRKQIEYLEDLKRKKER
jgi:hypothetical protein